MDHSAVGFDIGRVGWLIRFCTTVRALVPGAPTVTAATEHDPSAGPAPDAGDTGTTHDRQILTPLHTDMIMTAP